MKEVSHEVVKGGGLVRAIHNHGVRAVPVRFKAKHPDGLGERYFEKGRFVSVYMDCNPQTRINVQNVLARDEDILRQTHLRCRTWIDTVNLAKETKNPWVWRYERDQAREQSLKELHSE